MVRLLVLVEGETEETFVNEILRPHLYGSVEYRYEKVGARLIGNARQRNRRGGITSWNSARSEILRHLKEDQGSIVTTMVDYYELPQTGAKAWPGRSQAGRLPFAQKAITVEDALFADISQNMGGDFNARRFIPYVMMHELEGLLFSDCDRFASGIGKPDLALKLQAIRDQFATPEEINDSSTTAPSKRIQNLVPDYQKPLLGVLAVIDIGLDKLRAECPLFHHWIERLETWQI